MAINSRINVVIFWNGNTKALIFSSWNIKLNLFGSTSVFNMMYFSVLLSMTSNHARNKNPLFFLKSVLVRF